MSRGKHNMRMPETIDELEAGWNKTLAKPEESYSERQANRLFRMLSRRQAMPLLEIQALMHLSDCETITIVKLLQARRIVGISVGPEPVVYMRSKAPNGGHCSSLAEVLTPVSMVGRTCTAIIALSIFIGFWYSVVWIGYSLATKK